MSSQELFPMNLAPEIHRLLDEEDLRLEAAKDYELHGNINRYWKPKNIERMKAHIKIYHDAFGLIAGEFIACEICEAKAVDIHHIDARGMGGRKSADSISNLMALCRRCHDLYGDRSELKPMLREIHSKILEINQIKNDEDVNS